MDLITARELAQKLREQINYYSELYYEKMIRQSVTMSLTS